jgi:predicted N-acetyltransferase YhbS
MELEISVRPAQDSDLAAVSDVIDAAIMTWDLPERVKRLSRSSYHYNEADLRHYAIQVAMLGGRIVAVVAWDRQAHSVEQQQGLLLHGLYVHPDHQRQGIGARLFALAEQTARDFGLDGLLVKAQKDAQAFYRAHGMHQLAEDDSDSNFSARYWKRLN